MRAASVLAFAGLAWVCSAVSGVAQSHGVRPCRAGQIEIFEEPAGAGLGHSAQPIGLKNISRRPCTFFGIPKLEFADKAGKNIAIPYGKNNVDYLFGQQPQALVTVAPGGFAHFLTSTTTGDQHLHFHSMRVLLPGDATPLAIDGSADSGVWRVNVSAIVAGDDTDARWTAPDRHLVAERGSMPDRLVTASVPTEAEGPFDVHLSLRNTGKAPLHLDPKQCVLSERLTSSAGKVVRDSHECRAWSGEVSVRGLLAPGALATADIQAGDTALQLCREGTWTDALSLSTAAGYVRFAPFPFQVVNTDCSDSEPVGASVDESRLRWSLLPRHGVRLGVALQAQNGSVVPLATFSGFSTMQAPEFHAGEAIRLALYLDNLTDTPIVWRSGTSAFRVAVAVFGQGTLIEPVKAVAEAETAIEATILPHRWQSVATIDLSGQYALGPGSYEVIIGPRTLTGDAAGANAPASGWPYSSGSATTEAFVEIVP